MLLSGGSDALSFWESSSRQVLGLRLLPVFRVPTAEQVDRTVIAGSDPDGLISRSYGRITDDLTRLPEPAVPEAYFAAVRSAGSDDRLTQTGSY